jgi:hypothetical protein
MSSQTTQRGFLLIVAVVLLVVIAAFIAALGSMVSSDVKSSADTQGSVQAFYLAESGLEFEQRSWAQNLDWYRSATDPNPNPAIAQPVGAGSFTVYANLPATLLKAMLSAAATTITAYSTDRFPASGILQIEEDLTAGAEFVTYTNLVGSTFTGVARGQTVGTVTSTAGAHSRSDAVYPVTTLVDALSATSCSTIPAPFRIVYHPKFLTAGTLDIGGEEISYTGSSVAGGNMTLTGVTRCMGLAGPLALAFGYPVTPVLIGGDSASYEVEMVSTGTVGSDIRYARRTAQR